MSTPKEVFAPHLGRTVKLGRTRPVARGFRMKLRDYVSPALPTPPAAVDYTAKAAASLGSVYMNDRLGCCVIAGGYHVTGVATGNAGAEFVATDAQILADYSAIGGYVQGDPSTDQGCDEETALNYWTQHGFADGTKLAGFLELDPTNQTELQQALYLFENLYFGVELPDAWITPFPSAPGFVWDVGAPNIDNGHCFVGVGYSAQGVQIDTWGLLGTVTWAAISALCADADGGQLFTLLTPDMLAKGATTAPNGFAWSDLQTDLEALSPRGGLFTKAA